MFCCVCDDDVNGNKEKIVATSLVYVEQELNDGAVYKGYTRDGNIREGKGKYVYANKESYYDGEWKNGKFNGVGTFSDVDAEYIGQWVNDVKHGKFCFLLFR